MTNETNKIELMELIKMSDELINSKCSSTSQHIEDWFTVYDVAKLMVLVIDQGGIDGFLQHWIPESRRKLDENGFNRN